MAVDSSKTTSEGRSTGSEVTNASSPVAETTLPIPSGSILRLAKPGGNSIGVISPVVTSSSSGGSESSIPVRTA